MDLRLTFNLDPDGYDRFRPTYTPELFADVIEFSGLDGHGKALEIGMGTGQATLPFLQTGCHVTAIELGDQLARYAREKFAAYENLTVINQDFESVPLEENAYDLAYSATAFHWIPQQTGLPKVMGLLKGGGAFAWFSNHPGPAREHGHMHDEFQKVYQRHSQFFSGKPLADYDGRCREAAVNSRDRSEILRRYGFTDVWDKLYYSARTFTAGEYIALLSTYSDHKAMPEDIRRPFFEEIGGIIHANGGRFTLSDIIILSMGRKPRS